MYIKHILACKIKRNVTYLTCDKNIWNRKVELLIVQTLSDKVKIKIKSGKIYIWPKNPFWKKCPAQKYLGQNVWAEKSVGWNVRPLINLYNWKNNYWMKLKILWQNLVVANFEQLPFLLQYLQKSSAADTSEVGRG